MKQRHTALLRALVTFVLVFTASLGLDTFSMYEGIHRPEILALDAFITATIASVLVLVLIHRADERQEALERRLKLASEMNHHIRNALQSIVYANTIRPNEFSPMVQESVKRIEWALTEVLGKDGESAREGPDSFATIDGVHTPE